MPDWLNGGWLLAGGSALAILAGAWQWARGAMWQLASRLILVARYEREAGKLVAEWLFRHGKPSPFGDRRYSADPEYVRPAGKRMLVGWECISQTSARLVWLGWWPIIVRQDSPGPNNQQFQPSGTVITCLRWVLDPEQVLLAALSENNDDSPSFGRFRVQRVTGRLGEGPTHGQAGSPMEAKVAEEGCRPIGYSRDQLGEPKPKDPFAGLALPPEGERLVATVQKWLTARDWYESRRIPWRTGVLLYGPPGTGKSSLVRAAAQQFDLPIFVFDLSTMTNAEFANEWEAMTTQTPCVALFEDIDAVFHGRENVVTGERGGLTFDCLLNAIGGVSRADGVVLAVTTNRVELIDPALGIPDPERPGMSTRPGRIDAAIELGLMREDCRRKLARLIVGDCPTADALVANGEGDTPAQVQARCVAAALATGPLGEITCAGAKNQVK